MISELKENFFHLECCGKRLDEDGCPDCVVRHSNVGLGKEEDVIPQTGLEIVFHLGKIEVGARATLYELMGISVEVEPKVKEGPRNRGVVDRNTRLVQVPAPRSTQNINN